MLRVKSAPCLRSPSFLFSSPSGRTHNPLSDDSHISRSGSCSSMGSTLRCNAAVASMLLLQLAQDDATLQLQNFSHAVEQELVLESTLHVSAMQRLKCFQRLTTLPKEPSLFLDQQQEQHLQDTDCDTLDSFLLAAAGSHDNTDDDDDTDAQAEAAMWYATPFDFDDGEDIGSFRSGAARAAAAAPSKVATCARGATQSVLELDLLQQRALTTLELLNEKTSQAALTLRRQRRRYAVIARRRLRKLSNLDAASSTSSLSSLSSLDLSCLDAWNPFSGK